MTNRGRGAAALALLVASACSSGSPSATRVATTSSQPATSTTTTEPATTTTMPPSTAAADPLARLLQLSEVPSGFEALAPPKSGASSSGSTSLPCGLKPTGAVASTATVVYINKSSGATITDLILSLPSGQGKVLLDQASKALDSCHTITTSIASTSVTETITKVPVSSIGDQAIAATFSAKVGGTTVNGRITAARLGDQIGYVIISGTTPVDAALAEGLTRKQVAKL